MTIQSGVTFLIVKFIEIWKIPITENQYFSNAQTGKSFKEQDKINKIFNKHKIDSETLM